MFISKMSIIVGGDIKVFVRIIPHSIFEVASIISGKQRGPSKCQIL